MRRVLVCFLQFVNSVVPAYLCSPPPHQGPWFLKFACVAHNCSEYLSCSRPCPFSCLRAPVGVQVGQAKRDPSVDVFWIRWWLCPHRPSWPGLLRPMRRPRRETAASEKCRCTLSDSVVKNVPQILHLHARYGCLRPEDLTSTVFDHAQRPA